MSLKVFVYGTLRRGCGANQMLNSATFLGTATLNKDTLEVEEANQSPEALLVASPSGKATRKKAVMVLPAHRGFPYMVLLEPSTPGSPDTDVVGEVYQLPEDREEALRVLNRLDRYEGFPSLYQRSRGVAVGADGEDHEVLFYSKQMDIREGTACVASGDWTDRDTVHLFGEVV